MRADASEGTTTAGKSLPEGISPGELLYRVKNPDRAARAVSVRLRGSQANEGSETRFEHGPK